jgi:predicted nucleic acid-binding Zn ribbon protein
MKAILRLLGGWLLPSDEQALQWARVVFPPDKRRERQNLILWAFLLVLIALFVLVISGEIVGCPTKQLLGNASVEQLFFELPASN